MKRNYQLAIICLLGLCSLVACVSRLDRGTEARAMETAVQTLALAGSISDKDAEVSGMAWYNDYLILLPQYPDFAVKEDDGVIFALKKSDILAYLDGISQTPLEPIQIPFIAANLADNVDGFEGYEAVIFVDNQVYMTIEASPRGGMVGYLVTGTIEPDLSRLMLNTQKLSQISAQADINNLSDETIFVVDERLFTLYEGNGTEVTPNPVAHGFDFALTPVITVPMPHIEYRLTDATALDENNRFWAINYYFSGNWQLAPKSDPIAEIYGWGATQIDSKDVERLVEFQFDETGIQIVERPPIQLQMSDETRNWEGIVRLDDRGFLLITDKYPDTILGFVPFSE